MYCILVNALKFDDIATQTFLNNIGNSEYIYLVVTSDHPCVKWIKHTDNIHELQVQHNSIDFTALIAVVEEQELVKEHLGTIFEWFYVHATCKPGPNFNVPFGNNVCMPISSMAYNMNLGIYTYKRLLSCKKLLTLRSSNNPPLEEVKKLKHKGCGFEDFLFKKNARMRDLPRKLPRLNPKNATISCKIPKDIYGTGTMRKTIYFKKTDLYKYKANWVCIKNMILDI